MQLLAQIPPSELPAEALLARLRSRRAELDPGGSTVQPALSGRVDWLYRRLDGRCRRRLEPYLELLAMRSLLQCLRYALAGETLPAAVTTAPLLERRLVALLESGRDPERLLAVLGENLAGRYPFAAGLPRCWQRQGPGGVEQQLAGGQLAHSLASCCDPLVRRTVRYLLDTRNLLSVMKVWRWQVPLPPELTAGGQLSVAALSRIWKARDRERLAGLAGRLSGIRIAPCEATVMERHLLGGLGRLLRRAGREPLGLGVILDYLWRIQLAELNRMLRQHLGGERDELLAETLLL